MLLFLWHILVIVLHSQRWLSYGHLIIKAYNNIRHAIQSITINVLIANIYQFPVILISIISNRTSCLRAIIGVLWADLHDFKASGARHEKGQREPWGSSIILTHYCISPWEVWTVPTLAVHITALSPSVLGWLAACGGQGEKMMVDSNVYLLNTLGLTHK